jgi:hypothetical protein
MSINNSVNKTKVALCFFGTIARSIKFTYCSIKRNIIDKLKMDQNIELYIYGFNLDVENTRVDGVILNQDDIKVIEYNTLEQYKQSEFDSIEFNKLKQKTTVKFAPHYAYCNTINAIRQAYSEYRAGKILEDSDADIAIVCGPDFFIANEINMYDVYNSLNEPNVVYTSIMNDGGGYTYGF